MNKELFKENLKLKANMIDVHLEDNQLEKFFYYCKVHTRAKI